MANRRFYTIIKANEEYPVWKWDNELLHSCIQTGNKDECWEWTGKLKKDGTPLFYMCRGYEEVRRTSVNPQRILVAQKIGRTLLSSECVFGTCGRRGCMNPSHLVIGTNEQLHSAEHAFNITKWPAKWILEHLEEIRSCRSKKILIEKYGLNETQLQFIRQKTKRATQYEEIDLRNKNGLSDHL